ncbi:TetR/AcrR family transcriptional regulator [Stappia indica]|uniref:TetR/AcrR family transcriptional regulator n=1 Tax=Stappia indica TaxID=538381 RepID=UPI001CD6A803|nr:TetR/AcrR family transcriptional regulator [Stappia indica]MCA1299274.1 TetR/AcrR family transcriptional regulator [Stappia indica]
MASQKIRQKIVAAFLDLLGEKGWHGFEMAELALAADVKLSLLRAEFPSKTACFKAFLAEIDRKVLDAVDPDMAEEPARDRLFDVLMARLDALSPYRDAVRALKRAVRQDPQLAVCLNGCALTSQRWMLTAAGITASGPKAQAMTQGLVLAFARVVDVWLDDADPGLARSMAALDRELDRGEVWLQRLDGLARFVRPFLKRRRSGSRRRDEASGASDERESPAT